MEPLHTDRLLRIEYVDEPRGLQLTGEVDPTNEPALATQLYDLDRPDSDATVDLREVTFLSFTGLRILVCFAQTLRGGRRLLLQTKGPDVRTLLKACDWDALPNLALEPQEAHDV